MSYAHKAKRLRTTYFGSFPVVVIRSERRKDIAPTHRPSRSQDCFWTPGRKRTFLTRSYGPKEGHHLNVTSECDVLWTTVTDLEACIGSVFVLIFLYLIVHVCTNQEVLRFV